MRRRIFLRNLTFGMAGFYLIPVDVEGLRRADPVQLNDPENGFSQPPGSSRPWVMWFWMNGHVTRDGITLDLEMLKRNGFRGAFIYHFNGAIPPGTVKHGSNAWLDAVEHAVKEADRLGLEVVLQFPGNVVGEPASLPPEFRLRHMVWSEATVKAAGKLKVKLLPPPTTSGHYLDFKIMAFPQGTAEFTSETVFDITPLMNKKGIVSWMPPAPGNWTLVRVGSETTEGEQVIDPMNADALQLLLDNLTVNLMPRVAGKSFKGFFGLRSGPEPGTWSQADEVFFNLKEPRDHQPWLLNLTQKKAGSPQMSEPFRQDHLLYRLDQLEKVFFQGIGEWCHQRQVNWILLPENSVNGETGNLRNPSPGGDNMNPSDPQSPAGLLKASSSGGQTPATLLEEACNLYISGKNELIISPFTHQPYLTGLPGMSPGFPGMSAGRNNTWAEHTAGLTLYLSRIRFLLQQGTIVTGNAVSTGDGQKDGLEGDLTYTSARRNTCISWIHRKQEDSDIYFLTNTSGLREKINCSFRTGDLLPEIWNPETGEIFTAPIFNQVKGRISMPLEMEAGSALFVLFRKKITHPAMLKVTLDGKMLWNNEPFEFSGLASSSEISVQNDQAVEDLWVPSPLTFRADREHVLKGLITQNGEYNIEIFNESTEEKMTLYVDPCFQVSLDSFWRIDFPDGSGAPAFWEPEKLESLSLNSDPGIRYFSGICNYQTVFYLTDSDFIMGRKLLLDLGRVEVTARVVINGKDAGLAWKFPFIADISPWAVKGENKLTVEVATSWYNRLVGDEQLPPENSFSLGGFIEKMPDWFVNNQPKTGTRKTFLTSKVVSGNEKLQESGLLGPVKLIFGVERQL